MRSLFHTRAVIADNIGFVAPLDLGILGESKVVDIAEVFNTCGNDNFLKRNTFIKGAVANVSNSVGNDDLFNICPLLKSGIGDLVYTA